MRVIFQVLLMAAIAVGLQLVFSRTIRPLYQSQRLKALSTIAHSTAATEAQRRDAVVMINDVLEH